MNQEHIGLIKVEELEINKSTHLYANGAVKSYYQGNRIAQEQHHAMHALTFIHYMVIRTLRGERLKRRLLGRAIHHLSALREFLDDGLFSALVNSLLKSLECEYENSLFSLVRVAHCWIRGLARTFPENKRQRLISRVTAVFIQLSENDNHPVLSMYPWFVKNQDGVLRFAEHYGKKEIFKGLLPITGRMNFVGSQKEIEES